MRLRGGSPTTTRTPRGAACRRSAATTGRVASAARRMPRCDRSAWHWPSPRSAPPRTRPFGHPPSRPRRELRRDDRPGFLGRGLGLQILQGVHQKRGKLRTWYLVCPTCNRLKAGLRTWFPRAASCFPGFTPLRLPRELPVHRVNRPWIQHRPPAHPPCGAGWRVGWRRGPGAPLHGG